MFDFMDVLKVLTWTILFFELICIVLYAVHFFSSEKRLEPLMQRMLWLVTAAHFLLLGARGLYFGRHPMGTAFEAIFSFALVISIVYTYIEKHIAVRDTGLVVLGVGFILRFLALLSCRFDAMPSPMLQNRWFAYHSGAVIIGCASLLIASIYGALYIVQYWQLKHSKFTRLFDRLPSLEVLNEMNIHAVWYGFLFFTASMIFGMRWWKLEHGTYFSTDPKILMGYLTCAIFALHVVGHRFLGWNGKRLAYLSILGFSVIVFSATIVNIFSSTIHGVH